MLNNFLEAVHQASDKVWKRVIVTNYPVALDLYDIAKELKNIKDCKDVRVRRFTVPNKPQYRFDLVVLRVPETKIKEIEEELNKRFGDTHMALEDIYGPGAFHKMKESDIPINEAVHPVVNKLENFYVEYWYGSGIGPESVVNYLKTIDYCKNVEVKRFEDERSFSEPKKTYDYAILKMPKEKIIELEELLYKKFGYKMRLVSLYHENGIFKNPKLIKEIPIHEAVHSAPGSIKKWMIQFETMGRESNKRVKERLEFILKRQDAKDIQTEESTERIGGLWKEVGRTSFKAPEQKVKDITAAVEKAFYSFTINSFKIHVNVHAVQEYYDYHKKKQLKEQQDKRYNEAVHSVPAPEKANLYYTHWHEPDAKKRKKITETIIKTLEQNNVKVIDYDYEHMKDYLVVLFKTSPSKQYQDNPERIGILVGKKIEKLLGIPDIDMVIRNYYTDQTQLLTWFNRTRELKKKGFLEAVHATPSRLEMYEIKWRRTFIKMDEQWYQYAQEKCDKDLEEVLEHLKADYHINTDDAFPSTTLHSTYLEPVIKIKLPKDKIEDIRIYLTSFLDRPVNIEAWYD